MRFNSVHLCACLMLLSSCTSLDIKIGDGKIVINTKKDVLPQDGEKIKEDDSLIDNIERLDVSQYRQNKPDLKINTISPVLNNRALMYPSTYFEELVKELIKEIEDPFRVAKVLHDWIVLNISYGPKPQETDDTTYNNYINVLKNKKATPLGFSNLFNAMCNIAGIESKQISGTVRSIGFDPINNQNMGRKHFWNAIKISNCWYLVDISWDSSEVKGCGECAQQRRYSTNNFLLEPDKIIYTHFPDNKKWQLLETPINRTDFESLPIFTGEFFEYAELITQDLKCVNVVSGMFQIKFKAKPGKDLFVVVFDSKGKIIKETLLDENEGEDIIVNIDVNLFGLYRVVILTGQNGKGASTGSFYINNM